MTPEDHIDQAILDLQRARTMIHSDSQFALHCIGDARFAIAAAKIAIAHPPVPVKKRKATTNQRAEGVTAA